MQRLSKLPLQAFGSVGNSYLLICCATAACTGGTSASLRAPMTLIPAARKMSVPKTKATNQV
jgi:hypothetical protein